MCGRFAHAESAPHRLPPGNADNMPPPFTKERERQQPTATIPTTQKLDFGASLFREHGYTRNEKLPDIAAELSIGLTLYPPAHRRQAALGELLQNALKGKPVCR